MEGVVRIYPEANLARKWTAIDYFQAPLKKALRMQSFGSFCNDIIARFCDIIVRINFRDIILGDIIVRIVVVQTNNSRSDQF